jgi:hypothetical protein
MPVGNRINDGAPLALVRSFFNDLWDHPDSFIRLTMQFLDKRNSASLRFIV